MIIKNNNDYYFSKQGDPCAKLDNSVYKLCVDPKTMELYLSKIMDKFSLPSKLYGDFSIVERWIKTYEDKIKEHKNLGILLSGSRGAGKTLTAKYLCNKLLDKQPVILINSSIPKVALIEFFTNPELGNCIVFVDELEKTYKTKDGFSNKGTIGEDFLELLDGSFSTSHLYLFVTNESESLSSYLFNRPSRIHYYKEYKGLSKDIVREIGKDYKLSNEFIDDLIECSIKLGTNNTYDSIISIINESVRFNEKPSVAAANMNFKVEDFSFEVMVVTDGARGYKEKSYRLTYCNNIRLSNDYTFLVSASIYNPVEQDYFEYPLFRFKSKKEAMNFYNNHKDSTFDYKDIETFCKLNRIAASKFDEEDVERNSREIIAKSIKDGETTLTVTVRCDSDFEKIF